MNQNEIVELFGISDIEYSGKNITINIWHNKFSDYINYYNENLCDSINFNINFDSVKQSDTNCQNNLLLLSSLKTNTIVNISTSYGLGEIILENLKNIKCKINLNLINIFINDFNDEYKYSNITLYPMINNNYYTDETINKYCLTNNIKVVEY